MKEIIISSWLEAEELHPKMPSTLFSFTFVCSVNLLGHFGGLYNLPIFFCPKKCIQSPILDIFLEEEKVVESETIKKILEGHVGVGGLGFLFFCQKCHPGTKRGWDEVVLSKIVLLNFSPKHDNEWTGDPRDSLFELFIVFLT
jgi:hypothetical protein